MRLLRFDGGYRYDFNRNCHTCAGLSGGSSARDIVDWVWNRIVPGGLIVFDDYGFEMCPGITRLANEQMGMSDRLVFHNLNGHAIVMKLPRHVEDAI
jgi:hypothetical protein